MTADRSANEGHSTEMLVTANQKNLGEQVQHELQHGSSTRSSNQESQESIGHFQPRPFDPTQHYSQQTGTTNETVALTMLIVTVLVALGIFGILGLLIYRVITGI